MVKILIFLCLCLTACSGSENPKKLYLQDMSSLSDFEQTQIKSAMDLLTQGAGENFFSTSGNRPLILQKSFLEGTDMGFSQPRTYQCIIGIDTDSDLIRDEPRLIQYVFIHQLGHCYGLDYSSDQDSIMYPTFPGTWDSTVEDKLKDFSKTLRDLSR